ncbi:MAG TPA: alkaline phosphatase PhoX, partial [Dongiaceae bacterium]|nr:alkaline phosphatase PhoX [Dongiaceae bacterium]
GSVPVKRTALGRYCREGATVVLGPDGRVVVYSGDDAQGEYIYKFVSAGRYDASNPAANRNLLDTGTLYAAQFRASGREGSREGEWKALVLGQNGLTPTNGFNSQEEILLNARAAADRAGATPMDRPEWVAVHPVTREVYVTCTNHDKRGDDDPVDAANPRPHNLHGQILRWREANADPAATAFQWDLFLLAGDHADGRDGKGELIPSHLTGTIQGDIFSSPDGLAFDRAGRLWIETDFDDAAAQNQQMGCNQLLCADPVSRQVKRFLVGPRGCEITGITWTPDFRSMWINVQHPGLHFPASDGKTRPRSTTVLITQNKGGVIGT